MVNAEGVGTYDGRLRVEAENFFGAEGVVQKVELSGGGRGFGVIPVDDVTLLRCAGVSIVVAVHVD